MYSFFSNKRMELSDPDTAKRYAEEQHDQNDPPLCCYITGSMYISTKQLKSSIICGHLLSLLHEHDDLELEGMDLSAGLAKFTENLNKFNYWRHLVLEGEEGFLELYMHPNRFMKKFSHDNICLGFNFLKTYGYEYDYPQWEPFLNEALNIDVFAK